MLLIGSDPREVALISALLRAGASHPLMVTLVERADDAAAALLTGTVDAVLIAPANRSEPAVGSRVDGLESGRPDSSEDPTLSPTPLPPGDVLVQMRTMAPETAALVLAHDYSSSEAVAAFRGGAQDYLVLGELPAEELFRRLAHAVERQRLSQQLSRQALQDPLTRLPNRTLLMDRLGVALDRLRRSASMVAVMFLDVDSFKRINDSRGHAAGDRVLSALAARLMSVLRPMDTVARFAGDEFIFLLEGISAPAEAVAVAQRVREVVSLPLSLDDRVETLSVSIGVATTDDPETLPEELIARADEAMYRAKAASRHVEASSLDTPSSEEGRSEGAEPNPGREPGRALTEEERQQLSVQLRDVVRRQQLRVVYQPVYRLDGDRGLWGFEALVRWQHPDRGLIPPSEFLPLAEELGVLPEIGRYVLREALRMLGRLHGSDRSLTASVNLAHEQLDELELAAAVAELRAAGVEPKSLCVEIGERTISRNPEAAIRASQILRGAGVSVALDDYGATAIPLGDLRRLQADILKIDESIVEGLKATADGAMVGAVVDLGHALGMQVVAEGVETDEQLSGLRTLGCDGAQGYLLSRPMQADQLQALLSVAG